MNEPLDLASPRLLLRRLRPEDAGPIHAYRCLPEVARFQSWESFGPDDAAQLVADQETITPNTPSTWLQLVIVERQSGEIVGDCGIHFQSDEPRQVELGVTMAPAHQGRGLAAEALGSVLDYVFGSLGKHRVVAVTDAKNAAAAGLFRRLGFRQEAHFVEHVWFKGAWGSEYLFALLHREWEASLSKPRTSSA